MINPYVGEVSAFGFKRGLVGWIKCEGQLLSVQEFNQLFTVIGTFFGGDGLATFGLPNFAPITAEGGQFCISAFGAVPTGERKALTGETTLFVYQHAPPPGWVGCNGGPLQISQYQTLFKVLGTTFGGNGTTTFGVPEMSYVPPFDAPINIGLSQYCIADVPSGSTDEGFMGEIKIFPSTLPPNGWLPCDGRLLTISENTAMFSLLLTTYGGDGKTTFALPNITGLPAGLQGFICQLGVFPPPP
jgi:microcystin-dependent protein